MRNRILADGILVIAACTGPWWLALPLVIACILVFENFYEILILGIMLDSLYGIPVRFSPVPVIYTLCASVGLLGGAMLKKHIKFYL